MLILLHVILTQTNFQSIRLRLKLTRLWGVIRTFIRKPSYKKIRQKPDLVVIISLNK
jgi:hypothetical protein